MVGGAGFFYRLARRSESEFFLAGRRLPWWLPAASVFSTHTATDTPIWVTGEVYQHGLRGLWYTFFAAWTSVASFVSVRIYRRSVAFTQAEWQVVRFHGFGAELMRGWMAGWQVFMNMFILGWVGMAMGRVCELAFGWPVWVGLTIPTTITMFYTLAAGYWGVVMGDFLQGIVAIFAILLVSVVGIVAAGGPHGVITGVHSLGQAWRLNSLAFTGWFTGAFPTAWWITMLVIAVVGGFGMGTSIDWYIEAQRIQSAKTVRDSAYGIWWGGAITLLRNGIWAASIVAFFVMVPHIADQSVYELGWYRMGFELLPAGLVGMFFAAILAIHFSTVSSHMNLGALYFTRDLYQRYLDPKASERRLVWVGRIATAVLVGGSFFYGLMMQNLTQWLIFALWLMMAGIWLPNILQVVWWRFNSWGYLASWISNLGIAWLVVWVLPEFKVIPVLPDYLQFWSLMALGILVFLPATLLTPAEPMEHLVHFYLQTRPIGWWGPVKAEARRMGLLAGHPSEAAAAAAAKSGPRPLIRRRWTAEEADAWSREDWIAIILSPLCMAFAMVGAANLFLLRGSGVWQMALAIACAVFLFWVIDPKLRAVSVEYEQRQAEYLNRLEEKMHWRETVDRLDPGAEGA
ncbi:MAG: sodium:solute symporter [Gemmatimonadetes bacterium]|nr:sodium:solute symporter [Gemmatimonadota bacterium]